VIENILRRITGKRLTSAVGTFHVYKGSASADPIAVWLGFDGERPYRFAGASDGWHLIVDDADPKEIDMQESGVIRPRDLSTMPTFARAMNRRVLHGWLILSPSPKDVIGVRLDFDVSTMRILNWGDEIYVASELPNDADSQEIQESIVQ
jgi:hypothetical protein